MIHSHPFPRFFSLVLGLVFLFVMKEKLAAEKAALARIDEVLSSGKQPVRIVCFGDSVTGVYYHTGGHRAYPDLLEEALRQIHPEADVAVVNSGKSGHTTANGLRRIARDVLAHRPHLVVVMFGLNDVAKLPIHSYRRNLADIVSKCRNAGAEVVLCTPNAVTTTDERPVEKVIEYCEVVRAVANERGVPLCDVYAAFAELRDRDPEAWRLAMSDEIHPNLAGHRFIAEQLALAITGQATTL
ncbi:MAG: SGNH/GDSL hydrolase family protein [Verrucomicrobiales bacterium]